MIIYKDLLTGDEILSDNFKIKEVPGVPLLWEFDCENVKVSSNEDFQLDGANPSAEGEDAEDGGGESTVEQKLDIEVQFRMNNYGKMDKKAYTSDFKNYGKTLIKALTDKGKTAEVEEFKSGGQAALKYILANISNWDVYIGESMSDPCMKVLVDYREDGITPYGVVFKHGMDEMKV